MADIYDPISVNIFVRYLHYDVLNHRYKQVGDCYSTTIEMLRNNLLRYSGLGGAVGYGKHTRQDLKAWIVLEMVDKRGAQQVLEFENASQFIEFVKKNPPLAKAIGYEKK